MTCLAPSINTTVSHVTVNLFPAVEKGLSCLAMLQGNHLGLSLRGGMGVSGGVPHHLYPHLLGWPNSEPRSLSPAALLTVPDKAGF